MTQAEVLGLHAAYYGGYFVGPLSLGYYVLAKFGFRAAMMTGLVVYGCGTLVFWPSAVLTSYTAFTLSNFLVGFGLSCLEISANPFTALCGPLEYAEVRLNLSQGFQAIGTIVSPLLAQKVLFKNVLDAPSLIDVQWTYLGIALFDVILAVVFYYLPIPEASDEDLEELADQRSAVNRARVGPVRVVWVTLALGVFCQWCYVGGQEAIGNNTGSLVQGLRQSGDTGLSSIDYTTVAHTIFAVGHFVSAFLNYILKPRWILLVLFVGLIVTCVLSMDLHGPAGSAMAMLTFFFESGVFSIVFAICMRGMGAQTKLASALMTAAISGGAVFTVVQTVVANHHGIAYSFCVPAAVFAFGVIFPLYLNFVPAARMQVDPIHEARQTERDNRQPARTTSALSDPSAQTKQFGLAGILARRKSRTPEVPNAQHLERSSASCSPHSPDIVELLKSPCPVRKAPGSAEDAFDFAPWPDSPREASGGITHDLAAWPGEEKI